MTMKRLILSVLGAAALASVPGNNATAQDPVRPTGVPERALKASSSTPAPPRSETPRKATRRSPAKKAPKPLTDSDTTPLVSRQVPSTGAAAIMVVDALSGQVLYEK